MIKLDELADAIAEFDVAKVAASYGASGSKHVLISAIRHLPEPELNLLRQHVHELIRDAVTRTTHQLVSLGVEPGSTHPVSVRATQLYRGNDFN